MQNSIEGTVTVTLDTLAFDTDLWVQREIDLPVSLHLCAKPGTTIPDITTVISHPNPLGQCRGWLSSKLPDATLIASNSTADAARQVAARQASKKAPRTYTDYRRMLAEKDVELVIIATPDHQHYPNLMAALAAKKDVYLEKPMCHTIDEARQLVATVRETKRVLQVGSQTTSGDQWHKAKKAIADGMIGRHIMSQGSYHRNSIQGEWNWNIDPAAGPDGKGDVTGSKLAWRYDERRGLSDFATPLAVDGTLYMIGDGSLLTSFDATSGKVVKQERVGQPDSYYASPVAGDGKLYLASQQGILTVVKATPDFEELSSHALEDEEVWATPALAGHAVYVRGKEALYCFERAE